MAVVYLFDFLLQQHDWRFVGLAALVCLVAAYACMNLVRHARHSTGRPRRVWIGVAALAVGLGIWSTHFIGMLALRPGFALNYDLALTAASLVIAIAIGGLGIALAARGRTMLDHVLGGAVVGIAIAGMHFTGIAALVMGGSIGWNGGLVALSIIAGMALGAMSFLAAYKGRMLTGALLLTLAICGMHFTAMGAADLSGCFPLMASGALNNSWLSLGVALISLLVLGAATGSVLLDRAERHRIVIADAKLAEVSSLLEVATTHMAQGLCLFDSAGHMQFYNGRVAKLIGPAMEGRSLQGWHFGTLSQALETSADDLQLDRPAAEQRIAGMIAKLGGGETLDYLRTLNDGRVIRFVHSPITALDDVTDQQRAQAEISRLAYRDSLTNILNRAAFNDELDRVLVEAEAGDLNFAVVAIDLDRFKEINDTYGHAVGDQVLRELGQGLSAGLKKGEVVARMGGDEFAALKIFSTMDSLRDFLVRIETALFARIDTGEVVINSSGSIGVAIYPDDGGDRSRLLNNADLAMYRAKADMERHICYYEQDMDEHARERRSMARDLWVALEGDGFHLAYQVQKSVETNQITGYEALLRWDRPGHGLVSPADFIPVAEESGAIGAIGAWVLNTACADAAGWPEPYKIAVNISGVQLAQVELIETVRNALLRSGLAPSRLELEVTETSIIADKSRALHILRQIKAMGISIAIDDFGTGYSSLDTLRSFPFDKIKIDRSFMTTLDHNDQSRAIVRAILALGNSLSMPVLAEGVETTAQLAVLRAEGCTEAQGFLLGRPGAMTWSSAEPGGLPAAQIAPSRSLNRR